MKKYFYKILLSLLVVSAVVNPWGFNGHKIIANKGMNLLPTEMKEFKAWTDWVTAHSIDPDLRRDSIKEEWWRHFIDIDYYKEFNEGRMIRSRSELEKVYSDSIVHEIGLLPWSIEETFFNLVEAMKKRDAAKTKLYLADLAHYVADGHQPMHTVLNYDGQLTGQKGVHSRYEAKMVNRFEDKLINFESYYSLDEINSVLDYAFNFITEANSYTGLLFAADADAKKLSGDDTSEKYYNQLWYRTEYITQYLFNRGAQRYASLIYKAWRDAGSPQFKDFN